MCLMYDKMTVQYADSIYPLLKLSQLWAFHDIFIHVYAFVYVFEFVVDFQFTSCSRLMIAHTATSLNTILTWKWYFKNLYQF